MSFSGAILYWEATSLWTALSSSRNIFMRMNGSLPFWVSICQGLGRASRSDTLPWESPNTDSPKSRWLIENWLSCSFTWKQTYVTTLVECTHFLLLDDVRNTSISIKLFRNSDQTKTFRVETKIYWKFVPYSEKKSELGHSALNFHRIYKTTYKTTKILKQFYCRQKYSTFLTISSVLRLLNWSNCCCVIGGKTALRGRWEGEWWCGADGWEMRALVMEAILCKGLTAALGEKSSGGRIEFPRGELAVDMAGIPKQKNHSTVVPCCITAKVHLQGV